MAQEEIFAGEDHGAESALSWIVAHMPPPEEVDLHLACLWPGGNKQKTVEYQGATIHLLPCPRRGRAMLLFQRDTTYFRSLFGELKPDLVHGWGTEDSYGLVARRLAPQRHVIGIQGLIRTYYKHLPKSYRRMFVRATERITLRKARNVVAESQYALDSAAPLCPWAVKRVIEHPLRPEFLAASPSDGTAKTVLFVGAIDERKGVVDAIAAFSKVAPENWNLHVVGKGSSTNENRMQKLVKDTRTSGRFHHSPDLDAADLVKAMQESSVFLLPTRVDTGPTALKEALTMGLWPVCYDNSGPGEYIRKYRFGSLARNGDFDSLCRELRTALSDTPWKNAGHRKSLEDPTRHDFSREQAWKKLAQFYELVMCAA
ncbi:MAG TPA: glycosyltransferase [Chthoniobacterales bacterium]|nr:glycosyltransferase [Chthoniobacterales bacterium]